MGIQRKIWNHGDTIFLSRKTETKRSSSEKKKEIVVYLLWILMKNTMIKSYHEELRKRKLFWLQVYPQFDHWEPTHILHLESIKNIQFPVE